MYFPFLKLQKRCKRSAEIRRRICAMLPYILSRLGKKSNVFLASPVGLQENIGKMNK